MHCLILYSLLSTANAWIPNDLVLATAASLTFKELAIFNRTNKNAYKVLRPIFDVPSYCVIKNWHEVWPVLTIHEHFNHRKSSCLTYLRKWSSIFPSIVIDIYTSKNTAFAADAVHAIDARVPLNIIWTWPTYERIKNVLEAAQGTTRRLSLTFLGCDWDAEKTNLIAHHMIQSNIVKLAINYPRFISNQSWIFESIFDAMAASRLNEFYLKRGAYFLNPHVPVSGQSFANGIRQSHLKILEIENCVFTGLSFDQLKDSLPSTLKELRTNRLVHKIIASQNTAIDIPIQRLSLQSRERPALVRLDMLQLNSKNINSSLELFQRNVDSLLKFSVAQSRIDIYALRIVFDALPRSRVVSLNLAGNSMFGPLVNLEMLLHAVISTPTLRSLLIPSNEMTPRGAALVAKAMVLSNVTHLDLSYNHLSDTGAVSMASRLKNMKLTYLNVVGNEISNYGANALRNGVLEKNAPCILDLRGNSMNRERRGGYNCFQCSVS